MKGTAFIPNFEATASGRYMHQPRQLRPPRTSHLAGPYAARGFVAGQEGRSEATVSVSPRPEQPGPARSPVPGEPVRAATETAAGRE